MAVQTPGPSSCGKPNEKPPSTSNDEARGIVACDIPLGSETDMIDDAKGNIQRILRNDDLSTEAIHDGIFVGNPAGLKHARDTTLLEEFRGRFRSLESTVRQHEGTIKQHEGTIKQHEGTIKQCQSHIQALERSSPGFSACRNRFLSTVKRDKFGTASQSDYSNIATGNSVVHGGNCAFDASLYQTRSRQDFATYERLYGLHPGVVYMIQHHETLVTLDLYATFVASNRHIVSDRFHQAFENYINLLKSSEYSSDYLHGPPTPLTSAYWKFHECTNTEVSVLQDVD